MAEEYGSSDSTLRGHGQISRQRLPTASLLFVDREAEGEAEGAYDSMHRAS